MFRILSKCSLNIKKKEKEEYKLKREALSLH